MSFGQPAGLYSVDVNDGAVEVPPVPDQSDGLDWNKQYDERKRLNRFAKRSSKSSSPFMSKAFHQCGGGCNHHQANATSNSPTA